MDLTIPTAHTTSGTSSRDSTILMDRQQPWQQRARKRDRPPPPSAKIRAAPPQGEAPGACAAARGGQEEEVRDEDVDRFFALLADVREMRELWRRNGGEAATKRARVDYDGRKQDQQQLWRPTFVMEDFAFELKGSEVVQAEKFDSVPNLDLSFSM
ncbi:hypothetical protein E2562_028378 [Oryza meyeriana var. granulata]|uniref:Uncharacterized protein n=1 Tax=Oryza meyeriana var. granulata TaxID=110450 RepID=A0A6G1E3M6_9ORYZ|nr:hypothetical protein E2562_028378 [Oryza meyeriana var. granulata]